LPPSFPLLHSLIIFFHLFLSSPFLLGGLFHFAGLTAI
jgi:hypothetical protein